MTGPREQAAADNLSKQASELLKKVRVVTGSDSAILLLTRTAPDKETEGEVVANTAMYADLKPEVAQKVDLVEVVQQTLSAVLRRIQN